MTSTITTTPPWFETRPSKLEVDLFSIAARKWDHSSSNLASWDESGSYDGGMDATEPWALCRCALVDARLGFTRFRTCHLQIRRDAPTTLHATSAMADVHASCGASYALPPKTAMSTSIPMTK
ncbi:hypothetical protein LINPERHAP1_LOCUS16125 [Linum perenne]